MYIFSSNSFIEFYSQLCTYCWNINKSHRGYFLCSPCKLPAMHTHFYTCMGVRRNRCVNF